MQARSSAVADPDFFRFPHTPHLTWLGEGEPRDDKVLSRDEADALLAHPVLVEEKLDGANLGVSLDEAGDFRFQNRGQYLHRPYQGQFARLDAWLETKAEPLFDALNPNLLVFGEWCAARHSLNYSTLPDWWLVFDVYDRTIGHFWSACRRDAWAAENRLVTVTNLEAGRFALRELIDMVGSRQSRYREGPLEGIVVRPDGGSWSDVRAKLVRADFVQGIGTHWRHRPMDWNQLAIKK